MVPLLRDVVMLLGDMVMFMFMFMPILCAETVDSAPRARIEIPFEMCILELVFVYLEEMGRDGVESVCF